jgi:hypothetical protein
MELVATLLWDQWQVWRGMDGNFAVELVATFARNTQPLSVRRLRGERVELFGRSETLFPSLNHLLFFPDHVHEFDPN